MASEEPAFISSFAPSFTHRELSSTPSSPMSPTKTRFSKAIRMTAATDRTTKHVITVDAQERRNKAKIVRDKATEVAFLREHEKHVTNGEEDEFSNKIASFTKGLPHNSTNGLLANPEDFELFVKSIDTGRPEDQERVPLGPLSGERFESWIANNPFPAKVRGWESSGAGLTFDLEGADAQAFTMPPAPRLDSDELVTEVTELYAMALLRDDPIINFGNCFTDAGRKVERYIKALNSTPFIKDPDYYGAKDEKPRRRGPFDFQNVFRGIFKGDDVGPYLSQFIYIGTPGLGNLHLLTDGIIQYGSMSMDQRVRIATPYRDFMTTWGAYLDVQNGADVRGRESYENEAGNGYRFIATPRDLATYVHYDALYQAYLNATLIMLDMGVKFDRGIPSQDGTHRILGIPFQEPDEFDKQQGFAHFGGPHILTLVTEVATRALKAVRFQKFNTHRRLRPEAVGGLVDRYMNKKDSAVEAITSLTSRLDKGLMEEVSEHNYCQNQNCDRANDNMNGHEKSFLMPMAFPEGSPMHPVSLLFMIHASLSLIVRKSILMCLFYVSKLCSPMVPVMRL